MATFIVKTTSDRNLVLRADHFIFESHDQLYKFYSTKGQEVVIASLPACNVFAVMDKDFLESDSYVIHDLEDFDMLEPAYLDEDEP